MRAAIPMLFVCGSICLAQGIVTPTGSGSASGANTGDVTLGAVGSTPSANGASLSGQVLTLQPASSTQPGVVTAGAQTIAGAKTMSSGLACSAAAPQYSCSSATATCELDSATNAATASATVAPLTFRDTTGPKTLLTLLADFKGGDGGSVLTFNQGGGVNVQDTIAALTVNRNGWIELDGLGYTACGTAGGGACLQSAAKNFNVWSGNKNIINTNPGTSITFLDGIVASSTKTKGTITLSAGTGTATVLSGAVCTCVDTSATPLVLQCAVSGTTLTATQATGTHVIAYICL